MITSTLMVRRSRSSLTLCTRIEMRKMSQRSVKTMTVLRAVPSVSVFIKMRHYFGFIFNQPLSSNFEFLILVVIDSDKRDGEKQSKGKDTAAGSKPGQEEGKLAAPTDKKDATALSMQSGMSSSLVETSEDEEAKRKEAEKAAKQSKRGISAKELEADVDVVIEETETIFLLHIPSQVVAAQTSGDGDNEEVATVDAAIKRYDAFLENKKGSDNYTERGSQTLNLTQKTREVANKGFT